MNYKEHLIYLKENPTFNNNEWSRKMLYEYLVYSCITDTKAYILEYFRKYSDLLYEAEKILLTQKIR